MSSRARGNTPRGVTSHQLAYTLSSQRRHWQSGCQYRNVFSATSLLARNTGENMSTKYMLGRANTSISASSAEVRKVSVLTFYRLHYYLASDSVSSSLLSERRLEGIISAALPIYILQHELRSNIPSNHSSVNSSYHSANLTLSTIV